MCRSTPTSRPDETSPSPSSKHALRPNEDTNAAFSFLPDASETREMSRISRKVRVFCCAPNVSSQSAGECRRQRFPNLLSLPSPYLPLSKTAELTGSSAADIISTVEFDHTGNYLATGDKGGRVVLFERNETVSPPRRLALQQEISLTRAYLGANGTRTNLEKNLRIQIPYRIPISRTRI